MTGIQQQPVEVEMAIPLGGEEQMDTYPVLEDSISHPVSRGVEPSYVSIKMKGPGRPINIRVGEEEFLKPMISSTMEANAARQDQYSSGLLEKNVAVSQKKTGNTLTLDSALDSVEVSVDVSANHGPSTSGKLAFDTDESSLQSSSAFISQTGVISVAGQNSPRLRIDSEIDKDDRSFPGKIKSRYIQKTSGRKSESKKLKPEKQTPLHPECIQNLLEKFPDGLKEYIEINGKTHLLQIQLTPVEDQFDAENLDPNDVRNENAGASVDRPPDIHSSKSYYMGTEINPYYQQSAYVGLNEGYDSPSHPLDLSHQPLDLSKKIQENGLSCVQSDENLDHAYEGTDTHGMEENDTEEMLPEAEYGSEMDMYSEENNYFLPDGSCDEEVKSEEKRGDTAGSDYGVEEQPLFGYQGSTTYYEENRPNSALNQDKSYGEIMGENSDCSGENNQDDSLPSLSKLDLSEQNSDMNCAQVLLLPPRVQEQNLLLPSNEVVKGPFTILDFFKAGLLTAEQVHKISDQMKKRIKMAASNHIPVAERSLKVEEAQDAENNRTQTSVETESAAVLDIPSPAMPNLCSLELADSNGEILVRKEERIRLQLREKVKKNRLEHR